MSDIPQKKVIPKFKKKLHGFLSDESGKITKEDVLKMGMIAMGVSGITMGSLEQAIAAHTSGGGGNCFVTTNTPITYVVNGHVNQIITATDFCFGGTAHGSSHANHGSGGWC